MLSPFSLLLIIAQKVSSIGTTKMQSGIIIEDVSIDLNPSKVITAIINPKNIEPESPINILAGLKLWSKNPKVEPNIINVSTTDNPILPWRYAIIPIVKKNIALIPPASPSSPSIKFKQFIQPNVNKIVLG